MATEKLKYLVTADTKGFVTPMKAIGALAVTAFVAAVKVTADFEKELAKLRAISGASSKDMKALETDARNLGKSTAYTAVEVATLQTELAKLGFTTNDILNASGGVLDLAAGLGATLSEAAVLTGSTIRAFGLTTEETGRVVDVLAKSASSSALDFSKLTESLKVVAPIAKAANISFEDTVALLGTLANAGIHGSLAGTALRKIFIELNAKGLSLNDAYKLINESSDKLATASDLVGKRAGGALLTLADGIEPTNKLAEALRNASGAAAAMRAIIEDNLKDELKILNSALTDMGVTIGKEVVPALRSVITYLTDFINGTEDQLGFLDSLNKAWLLFYETMLLAGRAAEMVYQAFAVNNPLGDGLIPKESLERLMLFNEELKKVNSRIIDLSGGFITGGTTKTSTNTTTDTENKNNNNNNNNAPDGLFDDVDYELEAAEDALAYAESLDKVRLARDAAFGDSWWTNAMNKISEGLAMVKGDVTETTQAIEYGWKQVGLAIGSAVTTAVSSEGGFKNLGKSLLRALGGLLVSIGTAALLANTALKVFGIDISTGAAIGAIAFGTALGALSSGSSGASEGSSSSSPSSSSVGASPDLRSIQGGGSDGRNIGGYSTRDGGILISPDALRQAMQSSDRKYPTFS